jgi:CRP-like cAMP-binding protein
MDFAVFQGMREETRRKILASARAESHAQGAFLFHQGDPARHFYILCEGRVRLTVGDTGLLAYGASAAGDLLGWSALTENATYTASVECRTPVQVLKMERTQLDEILAADPGSGMIFFKHVAALLGRRLVASYQATLSVHGEREPRPGG